MSTITLENFKEYAVKELVNIYENEFINKDFFHNLIKETFDFYYEGIKTCLKQTKDDEKRIEKNNEKYEENKQIPELKNRIYEDNQIGFYLELEDLKTNKIIGGNGYTGYDLATYEYVLRDNLRQHLLYSYLGDIYKAYDCSEYADEFIDFNSELECVFEEMIEFFKDKSIHEIILDDITLESFNKLNEELAALQYEYQDLKTDYKQLKVNHDDLERFIESRGLKEDFFEYVTSL
ncbi:hypothetical protein [Macrococcoides caseolyticum]|uniref:hypothetical protein n=1 Tax=Macrococcoides caseolyticum TaxID=69966 RepID=UPI001F3D68DA|nr:hypothetical protein [Macrococcus caseolyticus]MCE4957242.1 hypothetical protein [Macrococcus caseolyticus]